MTRLSDALKRAQERAGAVPMVSPDPAAPPMWKFSPVETMYVPDEPAPERSQPVIATAARLEPPRFGTADRHKLVLDSGVDHALVEQYRQLAAAMHHAQKASGMCSAMITSAMPAEGKTLTSTNLALTLSESYQRRVLLIDADLRRPRLREVFGLPSTEGLTDSLQSSRDGRLPVHQVTPTLWVLTSGRVVPDPMSLLVSPAMRQLLDDAKQSFDWVVVDTPPIAILPDANLLAAMIDTTLLVVSSQSTPYPLVQRAVQAIGPARILGVILNRAELAGLPSSDGYYGANAYRPKSTKKRRLGWFRRRQAADPASL
jgi:protein-tyrosine kinase